MGRKRSSNAESIWRERLARHKRSGLTAAEFCRREGVCGASFYQWRKRLGQPGRRPEAKRQPIGASDKKNASQFVPVHVAGLRAAEIELPGGATVRVPLVGSEALRTAILAAGEVCREMRPC